MTDQKWPRAVRTTFRPDEQVQVGQAEYLDLERQGLLVVDPEPTPETENPDPEHRDTPEQVEAVRAGLAPAVRKPRNERN